MRYNAGPDIVLMVTPINVCCLWCCEYKPSLEDKVIVTVPPDYASACMHLVPDTYSC